MNKDQEERELGWDERIDDPESRSMTIFPDGNYPFTVQSYERGRHEGSEKLPACNMVIVNLDFDGGPQLGIASVKHKLFLHTKTIGLLAAFFRGVGLRKHGDPLDLSFDRVPGCSGWAKLGTRTYQGREYPDIKRFIFPENSPTHNAQPAPDPQPQPQVNALPPSDGIPF